MATLNFRHHEMAHRGDPGIKQNDAKHGYGLPRSLCELAMTGIRGTSLSIMRVVL